MCELTIVGELLIVWQLLTLALCIPSCDEMYFVQCKNVKSSIRLNPVSVCEYFILVGDVYIHNFMREYKTVCVYIVFDCQFGNNVLKKNLETMLHGRYCFNSDR